MVYSDKNEFLQKLEEKLGEMKASMDKVQSDMEDATDEEKAKLNEKMEELKETYELGTKRLEEFKETPDAIWGGLRDEVDAFWKKLTGE